MIENIIVIIAILLFVISSIYFLVLLKRFLKLFEAYIKERGGEDD